MFKEDYQIYLREIYRTRQGLQLSESSVLHYSNESIRKIDELLLQSNYFHNKGYQSLYEIDSYSELKRIQKDLFSLPEFISLNERGNHMYSAGFNRYMDYAEGLRFHKCEEKLQSFDVPRPVIPDQYILKERPIYIRDRIAVKQIEEASDYSCERDKKHLTFISESSGKRYVEVHHLIPLSMQSYFKNSLDVFSNMIVLCPTCHRFLHFGKTNDRTYALEELYEKRAQRFSNAGLELSKNDFKEIAMRKVSGENTSNYY